VSLRVDRLIQRDRAIVLAGLFGMVGLSWLYLLRLGRQMRPMADMAMAMPQMTPWSVADISLAFLMWTVMMVAMMVPSATPMILVFAAANRKRPAEQTPAIRTGFFLFGYLLLWAAYSLLAALGQWGLHTAALVSGPAVVVSPWLGGVLLVVAGVYQFTPLKDACLSRCQSPIGFILSEWREGAAGAIVMGLRHGAFCIGCCWALMALLFVAGVMNLLWVAAIAAFVLVEKVVPAGRVVSRLAGTILLTWGAWVLTRAL
jgi:predicted metal-binding membrane protein